MLGGNARAILKGEARVDIVIPPKAEGRRARTRGGESNPAGDPLFEALRTCRRDLAESAGVPPYVIFHDSTLREMASTRPANRGDLALLSGIGTRKLEAYGDAFLAVIRSH
jgi:ATP-dependent DNA helicase RecQ